MSVDSNAPVTVGVVTRSVEFLSIVAFVEVVVVASHVAVVVEGDIWN